MRAHRGLICHVIYRLAVGGLENGLVNLINHLPAGRYRHAVLCVTETTDFSRRIERDDVVIHQLHKRPGKDPAAYARAWRFLNRLKPQIVHTRNLPALDMLAPAWLARVPHLVHSEHGRDLLELDGRNVKYNRLRRASRAVVARYITVSRDLHDWLASEIGVPERRLATIYNGVDTERFSPTPEGGRRVLPEGFAPPDAIVLGTLGRFEVVKNQLGLARAFGLVLERRPDLRARLRLVLIGEGSQRAAIEETLAAAAARDLAWLPGFRDDTPALYRALDLFILPSLREGISNTILEAMACGRPVLATEVGGNPEILPNGVAGRWVAPDDPEALAAAILDYIDHPALLRTQGEAGRRHVLERFSLAAMVKNYDQVYGALL